MTSTRPHPDTLRAFFEALPISAFEGAVGRRPKKFLPHLFGPHTYVKAMVECSNFGSWVCGWTVITRLPDVAGWFAFVIRERDTRTSIDVDWKDLRRWRRIELLSVSLTRNVWTGSDLTDLAGRIAETEPDGWDLENYRFDVPGMLDDAAQVWALRHIDALVPVPDRAAYATLLALTIPPHQLGAIRRLTEAASNVAVNRKVDDVEIIEAVRVAARSLDVAEPSGYEIEKAGLGGALMVHPRTKWAEVAKTLMERAIENGTFRTRTQVERDKAEKAAARQRRARISPFVIAA